MNLYIAIHHHRHGLDVYPCYASSIAEAEEKIVGKIEDYEQGREDEWIETRGPFLDKTIPRL